MNQSLSSLDPIYERIQMYMSAGEKKAYCERLIRDTNNFLLQNTKYPHDRIKDKYEKIIGAAKLELEILNLGQSPNG